MAHVVSDLEIKDQIIYGAFGQTLDDTLNMSIEYGNPTWEGCGVHIRSLSLELFVLCPSSSLLHPNPNLQASKSMAKKGISEVGTKNEIPEQIATHSFCSSFYSTLESFNSRS